MYCIEFGDRLDYGILHETLEEAQNTCDYFNKLNGHNSFRPHLMTESEIEEYKQEQEVWDNLY